LLGSLALSGWAAVRLGQLRRQRVILDPENQTVTFENFRIGRSFWSFERAPSYVCSYGDILDAHFMRGFGGPGLLRIVTRIGTVDVTSEFACFEQLREVLSAASRETPAGPAYENPWVWLWIGLITAALLIGFFLVMGWI
jgi:hypothetical protein